MSENTSPFDRIAHLGARSVTVADRTPHDSLSHDGAVTRGDGQIVCTGMTDIEAPPTTTHRTRFVQVVSHWWPVPAFIAISLVVQMRFMSRYDVGGHAAEHLGSVSAPFMAAAVIGILFWATPQALRQVDVVLATAAWFAMTVVVMIGNLRVVDDLVQAGYGFTPTSTVPDIADHSLANSSIWWAVVAALALVAAFRRRHHIGDAATVGACVAMIFPPWMIPGAGVIVLTIVRSVGHGRERRGAYPIDERA